MGEEEHKKAMTGMLYLCEVLRACLLEDEMAFEEVVSTIRTRDWGESILPAAVYLLRQQLIPNAENSSMQLIDYIDLEIADYRILLDEA